MTFNTPIRSEEKARSNFNYKYELLLEADLKLLKKSRRNVISKF